MPRNQELVYKTTFIYGANFNEVNFRANLSNHYAKTGRGRSHLYKNLQNIEFDRSTACNPTSPARLSLDFLNLIPFIWI